MTLSRFCLFLVLSAGCVGSGQATDDDPDTAIPADPEEACIASGGTVTTAQCCSAGDFPDMCSTGACGCSPDNSVEVQSCSCPPDMCFDGTSCVSEG